MNMALTTNREPTNEIASPKIFFRDVKSKNSTRARTQASRSYSRNCILIDKINQFNATDSKMVKIFDYEYHHWGANTNSMDISNRRNKGLEFLRLIEKGQEMKKPANFGFFAVIRTKKFGSPSDRTKQEEMRWRQLICHYYSGTTKETDGVADVSSSTS